MSSTTYDLKTHPTEASINTALERLAFSLTEFQQDMKLAQASSPEKQPYNTSQVFKLKEKELISGLVTITQLCEDSINQVDITSSALVVLDNHVKFALLLADLAGELLSLSSSYFTLFAAKSEDTTLEIEPLRVESFLEESQKHIEQLENPVPIDKPERLN